MANFLSQKKVAMALTQKALLGQTRSKGYMPAWHHAARVSGLLESILAETKEGTRSERDSIILAGLGHDLLEDSKLTEKAIKAVFGTRRLELIKGMTNRLGDENHAPYVSQVTKAEEAVRLIKFSDLFDNCMSVTFTIGLLGAKWTKEWFLPIVEPMIVATLPTTFSHYPKTAARLKDLVKLAHQAVRDELHRFTKKTRYATKK